MDMPASLVPVPERLETPRLTLTAVRPEDAGEVYRATVESLDRLLPWMPWAHAGQSPQASEAFARRACAAFVLRRELNFVARLTAAPGTLVVACGMHNLDWSVPRFEIGYWSRTGHEGKGYVRECVAALTDLAFETLGARRVEIRCDARNVRSAAVALGSGYVLEGTLRQHERAPDGGLRDTLVFARVAAE